MTTVLKLATVSKANYFWDSKWLVSVSFSCVFCVRRRLIKYYVLDFFVSICGKTATSPSSTASSSVGTPACSPDHLLVGLFICPPTRPLDSLHSNNNFCFIVGLGFIILGTLFFTSQNRTTHCLIR